MAYKFFKIKVLDQRTTMVIDKLLNEMKINYNCQSNGVSSTYSVWLSEYEVNNLERLVKDYENIIFTIYRTSNRITMQYDMDKWRLEPDVGGR